MDSVISEKKVVVCDLDGTLALSKSIIQQDMVSTIVQLLEKHHFAVISGGDWGQFENQFLKPFISSGIPNIRFEHLLIFPTSGAECRMYDTASHVWKQIYDNVLSDEEKNKIMEAFRTVTSQFSDELDIQTTEKYGVLVEDRGEQITFSGCGQYAPLSVKSTWDPDQIKRNRIIGELLKYIPEFEISMGGTTSIDITKKGINKAYAIEKMKEILSVTTKDIVFIGDALYPGGNDAIARTSGVDCIQVSGPGETEEILKKI